MDAAFEAVVQAAGIETRYVSRGRGEPVVLVGTNDGDRQRLAALVAGEQRIIEPVPPTLGPDSDGAELGRWLLGFVEGLGLYGPKVFLAPELAAAAPAVMVALAPVEGMVAVVIRELDH
jgi:hypothetical protein